MTNNELQDLVMQGDERLTDAVNRLRRLEAAASQLFQTGLANELGFVRLQVNNGLCELRKAVDTLFDNRFTAAEQASVNQVNSALAVVQR